MRTTEAKSSAITTTTGKVFTVLSATFYMMYCGTPYVIGTISPYIASYFRVESHQV